MNEPQPVSPRRRLQELLAIPDNRRTEAQWDELNELEISLAPVNQAVDPDKQRQRSNGGGGGGGGGSPGGDGRSGRSPKSRKSSMRPQKRPPRAAES